jgi:arginase
MGKTRKNISLFGINDCKKPKKNFTFKKANLKIKIKKNKKYNFNTIILFPSKLGQTKSGVEKTPKYLRKFINKKKHLIKYVPNTGNLFKNLDDLYKVNHSTNGNIINIGGDHSMSIATIADSLNKFSNLKVIYFDAHADLNTFEYSKSKNYHGMPLSFITGIDKNRHFYFIKNLLAFKNLLYIGSRCWDDFEINEIYKEKIKFLTPENINNNFNDSVEKILVFIGNSPIHLSFDVDSIDPKYIPSTGTPVKNGIELNKAIELLDLINSNSNIIKLDITELNMKIGNQSEGKKSGTNTEKLFHKFIDG